MNSIGYTEATERIDKIIVLLRDVAALVGQSNGRVLTHPESGVEFVPGIGLDDEAKALLQRADDLQKGSFRVLVMGEFKNGKSTLLNALLGEEILPAKVTPATAVITVIVSGTNRTVRVHERDHIGNLNVRELTSDEFKKEFTITKDDQATLNNRNKLDRFERIQFVELESTYALVRNKVSLIDSPGLGERESRTKVTRSYLRQVQALVLVLRADQILADTERDFLQELNSNRLEHVFILVNRINLVSEHEVDDLKAFVRDGLAEYYCNDQNEFDEELYNRRVYFVNALGALEARTGKISDPSASQRALAGSGIPEFERELEQFLTTEQRINAVLATTLYVTANTTQKALGKIETTRQALSEDLPELEQRRRDTELQLRDLELDKKEIEAQIQRYGSIAARKVYQNLLDMVDVLPSTWDHDSQTIINLDGVIKIGQLTKGAFSEAAKKEIESAITGEVEKYVDIKLAAWSAEADRIVQDIMQEMARDIQLNLENFETKLNDIAQFFASGTYRPQVIQSDTGGKKAFKLGLLATYLLFVPGGWSDVGMATSLLWNKFDLRLMLKQLMQQVAIIIGAIIVGTFFGGPVAWMALFGAQTVSGASAWETTKKRIRTSIGMELTKTLKDEARKMQNTVNEGVAASFDRAASDITSALQKEIDTVRSGQDEVIKLLQGKNEAIEGEKARLDAIRASLAGVIGDASELAYGRRLTLDDIQQRTNPGL